jgi:hypothetical protein
MTHYRPITPEEAVLIRRLVDDGLGPRAIARRLGRNKSTVEGHLRRHGIVTAHATRQPPPLRTDLAAPTAWLDQPPGRVRAARQAEGIDP